MFRNIYYSSWLTDPCQADKNRHTVLVVVKEDVAGEVDEAESVDVIWDFLTHNYFGCSEQQQASSWPPSTCNKEENRVSSSVWRSREVRGEGQHWHWDYVNWQHSRVISNSERPVWAQNMKEGWVCFPGHIYIYICICATINEWAQ